MSKEYQIIVPAHPSIYIDNPENRNLQIYFCEPEGGINSNTGILLLISGFGERADSPEAQANRSFYSNELNVVTVQCAYFGEPFMQLSQSAIFQIDINALKQVFSEDELREIYDGHRVDLEQLIQLGGKYDTSITGFEQLNETLNHFNDMGVMQVLDNLTALCVVEAIIKDNKYVINANRMMAYGQGHGAYLAYLCNAFAPQLFSCIIDQSAWLFPAYLRDNRVFTQLYGKMKISTVFDYLISKTPYDEELLHLPRLYKKFTNQCHIFSGQLAGGDSMVELQKKSFCHSVKLCKFDLFTNADEKQWSSRMIYQFEKNRLDKEVAIEHKLPITQIKTEKYQYSINYSQGVPLLTRKLRNNQSKYLGSMLLH